MRQGKLWKIMLLVIITLCMFSCIGCGSDAVKNTPEDSFYERAGENEALLDDGYVSNADKIYQNAMERFMEPGNAEKLEGTDIFDKVNRQFLSGYHRTYRVFRSSSPVIIVCSIAIGILMMVLARQNKKVKRTGLMVFMIGIPAAVIVAVFGIGILNGVLLY